MPLLPFPAYQPDVVDYQGNSSLTISGVVPRADGYGPVPAPNVYTAALPAQCRGAFVGWKTDGTVSIIAGTSTNLYVLDNSTLTWTLRSKGGGPYTALAAPDQWQFAQFNNLIIAVQDNTTPQFYNLAAPAAFADLSTSVGALGTPPNAAYVTVVGRFLVLTGIVAGSGSVAGANPYRVHWSGLDKPATWDGTNSSDFQDLPDGGIVRGVAGGESGLIFQDSAIRRMTYTQETTLVFQIERISQDIGLYAPYSLTRAGQVIFFVSPQGLNRVAPGEFPIEIGKGKFNRTLMNDLDRGQLQFAIGASDPRQSRLLLAYNSISNSDTTHYDKFLCYDYLLDRATIIPIQGEYIFTVAQPGLTLEGLDTLASIGITVSAAAAGFGGIIFRLTISGLTSTSGANLNNANAIRLGALTGGLTSLSTATSYKFNIIDSTHIDLIGTTFTSTGTATIAGIDGSLSSLDTFTNALTPELAHFDTSHRLCFFRGSPMEATLDSAEQGTDGRRLRVRGFRPITDATTAFGSLYTRETVQASSVATAEQAINAIGMCPQNKSARYARGRLRIPAGTTWTYAVGVEPDFTLEGLR